MAGQGGNVYLMRHQNGRLGQWCLAQPFPQSLGLGPLHPPVLKEGIQRRHFLHRPQGQAPRGFQTAAPLAGVNLCSLDTIVPKQSADAV